MNVFADLVCKGCNDTLVMHPSILEEIDSIRHLLMNEKQGTALERASSSSLARSLADSPYQP